MLQCTSYVFFCYAVLQGSPDTEKLLFCCLMHSSGSATASSGKQRKLRFLLLPDAMFSEQVSSLLLGSISPAAAQLAPDAPALLCLCCLTMQLRDRELRLVTRVPYDLEVLGDADRIVQVGVCSSLRNSNHHARCGVASATSRPLGAIFLRQLCVVLVFRRCSATVLRKLHLAVSALQPALPMAAVSQAGLWFPAVAATTACARLKCYAQGVSHHMRCSSFLPLASLLQVLNNLVSNAVKFTETGTITISARVCKHPGLSGSSSRAGSRPGSSNGARFKAGGSGAAAAAAAAAAGSLQEVVLVSVEDTGLGIPEDKLQAVFEAFEQVR
jgi:hypothetical protein